MSNLPSAFIENLRPQFEDDIISDLVDCIKAKQSLTSIRLNPLKPNCSFDLGEPVKWCDGAYYLKERPNNFAHDPFFHAGGYYVQEASSMLIAMALKQYVNGQKGLKVLDLCAAPGGKSTLIAANLPENSLLVSNEVIKSRYPILKENLMKWGHTNVCLLNEDPSNLTYLKNEFDWIFVDAPCSGEGLFRKNFKAVKHWSLDNVELCAARQKRILAEAIELLKPGGFLLYSTCTYNPTENIKNVEWLLSEFGMNCKAISDLEEMGVLKIESGSGVGYQALPSRVQGEGFFMSLVQKTGNTIEGNKKKRKGKNKLNPFLKSKANVPFKFLDDHELFEQNDKLFLMPKHFENFIQKIKNVELFKVGSSIREKFLPSHFLSQNPILNSDIQTIEVNKQQALAYLSKNEISQNNISSLKGNYIVKYKNHSLGFVKAIGTRLNNNYPKEYRLRKIN